MGECDMNVRFGILLSILVLFGTSHALFVNVNPITDRTSPGGMFEYEITVLNNDDTTKHMTVQRTFISWESEATPYSFDLAPDASEVVNFKMYAPDEVNTCGDDLVYQPSLYINDGTQSQRVPLLAIVGVPQSQRLYVTNFETTSPINTREPIPLTFVVNNGCTEAEMQVELKLVKDNATYSRQNYTILFPRGVDTYSVNMSIDHLTTPGDYMLSMEIFYSNNLVRSSSIDVEIEPYSNPEITYETFWTLLGESVNVRVVNNGTLAIYNLTAVKPINLVERYLTYYSSEGAVISELSISWFIEELPVGGEVTYTFSVTFVPILIIPFILIFIAFIFFLWTRKVIVVKDIVDYKMEGGTLQMKMQIRIHNVHKRSIFNLTISETLPPFVSAVAGFGSLNGKIVSKKGGKKIQWHLDEVRPDEEVLLSYSMKTRVEILGPVELPPTYISFENKKGKMFERKSNIVEVVTVTGTVDK
jgi:hypothetical protein